MAGTHTREPPREGVNRGKRYSRALYRVQITMAGTHTREPPPEGVNRGKSNSKALYRVQITMAGTREPPPKAVNRDKSNSKTSIECKSQWQGHTQESRRPKASMAASATAEPPSKPETANHNGRDTHKRTAARRRQSRQAQQQSLL